MVLNAVQNGAKCKMKSINIRCNGINKALSSHETHGLKVQYTHQKVGFLGLKVRNWASKIMRWQPI